MSYPFAVLLSVPGLSGQEAPGSHPLPGSPKAPAPRWGVGWGRGAPHPRAPPSVLGLTRRGRSGAPGPEEAAGPAADEEEPVELGGQEQRGAQVDVGRDGEGHGEQRQAGVPPVGPVQVGEEQHPAAQEADQHQGPVHLVQHSVLLLVLRWAGRWAGRSGAGGAPAPPPSSDPASPAPSLPPLPDLVP